MDRVARRRRARGRRIILDSDLAALYGVSVKRLNEQVRRNPARFPAEFMFRLTSREFGRLRSQIATSKGRGGRRYPPLAFTGHGAIMAATVLNSRAAVAMSLQIVRAFVQMRRMSGAVADLAQRLGELERRMVDHDRKLAVVFQAVRELLEPAPDPPARRIGFHRPPA